MKTFKMSRQANVLTIEMDEMCTSSTPVDLQFKTCIESSTLSPIQSSSKDEAEARLPKDTALKLSPIISQNNKVQKQVCSHLNLPEYVIRSVVGRSLRESSCISVGGGVLNLTTRTAMETVAINDSVTLSYHGITYSVQPNKKCALANVFRGKEDVKPYPILTNVSGIFGQGMNAVMGPSGSGKSSLLKILSRRISCSRYIGSCYINNRAFPRNFAKMCGFVNQDACLNASLTPRQNFIYSLLLRRKLPMKEEESTAIVNEWLNILKLENCRDTKAGDALKSNLSGGERKRTAIGIELLANPKCIFLDEPTSQLDSFTSKQLMQTLKSYSSTGRTVVFSIHQPSNAIFEMFDSLTLICKGKVVYCGEASQAVGYFKQLGYRMGKYHTNPEFISDILYGNISLSHLLPVSFLSLATCSPREVTNVKPLNIPDIRIIHPEEESGQSHPSLKSYFTTENNNESSMTSKTTGHSNISQRGQCSVTFEHFSFSRTDKTVLEVRNEEISSGLLRQFSSSQLGMKLSDELDHIRTHLSKIKFKSEWRASASFISELKILTKRALTSSLGLFIVLFVLNAIIGIFFGILYWKKTLSSDTLIQNRLGMFFYLSVQGLIVPSIMTAKFFHRNENNTLRHELESGYYQIISFVMSRFVVLLMARLVSAVTLSSIVYWMTGLQANAVAFLMFVFTAFASGLVCDCLCLLSIVSFSTFEIGQHAVVAYLMVSAVFSGFLLDFRSASVWTKWIKYLSVIRYCYLAWLLIEFGNSKTEPCKAILKSARGIIIYNQTQGVVKLRSRLEHHREEVHDHPHETCEVSEERVVLREIIGDDVIFEDYVWLPHVILLTSSVILIILVYFQMK